MMNSKFSVTKKLLALIFVLGLLSSNLFAISTMTVSSEELSFKIPAKWEVTYDDDVDAEFLFNVCSPTYEGDTYCEGVTVVQDIFDDGEKFTAKSYLDSLLKDCERRNKETYELLDRKKDIAAVRYVHPGIGENGTDVVQFIRIIVKKNCAYIICSTALPETVKSYEDEFNLILMTAK